MFLPGVELVPKPLGTFCTQPVSPDSDVVQNPIKLETALGCRDLAICYKGPMLVAGFPEVGWPLKLLQIIIMNRPTDLDNHIPLLE